LAPSVNISCGRATTFLEADLRFNDGKLDQKTTLFLEVLYVELRLYLGANR
jgi:hypothetical protein